jgi:hypothetical protein
MGKTPFIRLNTERESINMVSAFANQDTARFRLFEGGFKSDSLIDFIGRLLKNAERKGILILENVPASQSKLVEAWPAKRALMIEVV